MAIAGATLIAILARPRLSWLWLLLAFAVWPFVQDNGIRREYQRRRLALLAARRELANLRVAWQQEATDRAFVRKLHELHELRDRYRNLSADFQRDLRRLETAQHQLQLRAFLEGHFIDSAQIPGIRATDRMALESYGIETAADVTPAALEAVPGFGQRLGRQRVTALLAWRQALERRFRHDPRQMIDPTMIATLQQQYAQRRSRIEQELLAAPDELAKIKTEILKQRAQLNIALIRQAMQEAQAQADLRVFRPPGLAAILRWRNRA